MRVGLVGFSTPTGIGTNCRRLWKNLPIDKWMVPHHPMFGFGDIAENPKQLGIYKLNENDSITPIDFLSGLDIVVSYETTWPKNLFELAKSQDIKTVLICNAEWVKPDDLSFKLADKLIIRTKHGRDYLHKLGFGAITHYVPCPIDLDEFKFRKRAIVKRGIFTNGLGGVNRRKGSEVIIQALKHAPNLPLDVYSIIPINGLKTKGQAKSIVEFYDNADFAVQPSLYEGTGMSILEAMACGVPCLTTDWAPMNEYIYGAFGKEADKFLFKNPKIREVYSGAALWEAATSDHLEVINKVNALLKTDISEYSQMARDYIERIHGQTAFENLWHTIIS